MGHFAAQISTRVFSVDEVLSPYVYVFYISFIVSFLFTPIMQRVANDYPNIKFAIVDGVIFKEDGKTPMDNVASLVFREHEGSYLVGMIAASKS